MNIQKIKIKNVEIIGQESEWPEIRVQSLMEDLEHLIEKYNSAVEQRDDIGVSILMAEFIGFLGGLRVSNVRVDWTFEERKPVN